MSTRKIDPADTRRRVIEATVECLVEYGYSGTTTQRVQEQAGVSRGAMLHHFPSKAEMFVAALRHISEQKIQGIRQAAAKSVPASNRLDFAISVLHEAMSGPLYLAGYELWMAARTDEHLRSVLAPHERKVGRTLRELGVEVFGPEYATQPGFPIAFESLVQVMRGLAVTAVLREKPKLPAKRILAAWRDAFPALCAAGGTRGRGK